MERVMVQLTPAQIEHAQGRGNLVQGLRGALDWAALWERFGSVTGQEMRDMEVRIVNHLRSQ